MSRRCEGTTAAGQHCRRTVPAGQLYCPSHGDEAEREREDLKARIVEGLELRFAWAPAAEYAGTTYMTLRWLRDEDPEFAARCAQARASALDKVETALLTRAIGIEIKDASGNVKNVIYSDKAAELLLRGERPQYRQGQEVAPPVATNPAEDTARQLLEDPDLADAMDELLAGLDNE